MVKKRNSKITSIVITLIMIIFVSILIMLIVKRYNQYNQRQRAAENFPPAFVKLKEISKSKVAKYFEARGVIESSHIYYLYFQSCGRVNWVKENQPGIPIMPGDRVNSNETLAILENSAQQAKIRLARARVTWARANLQLAQEKMNGAQELVELTEKEYEIRQRQGGVMLGSSKMALAKAKITRRQCKVAVFTAKNKLAEMDAELELAKVELQKTEIRAPINGKIIVQNLHVGQYVLPQQLFNNPKLFRSLCPIVVIDPDKMWVKTLLVSEQLAMLPKKCKVKIMCARNPQKVLALGRLQGYRKHAYDDNMHEGLILLSDKRQKMLHGGDVRVKFFLGREDILIIPREALLYQDGHIFVYKIDKENRAQRVAVSVGRKFAEGMELLTGLKAGMKVVTNGRYRLHHGQKITTTQITGEQK